MLNVKSMPEGISETLEMKLRPKALHIEFEWFFLGFKLIQRKQKFSLKAAIVYLLRIFLL